MPRGTHLAAKFVRGIALAALLLHPIARSAVGDTLWVRPAGDPGDWSDPANWSAGEPNGSGSGPAYVARVDNGGTVLVAQPDEAYSFLFLGYWSGDSGIVRVRPGGRLVASDYTRVGYFGVGRFENDGGQHVASHPGYGGLQIGYRNAAVSSYVLSGSGELTSYSEIIGNAGAGEFIQSSGTNRSGSLWMANERGSSGRYELADGELRAAYEMIGNSGVGVFTQSGGTNYVTGYSGDRELCLGGLAGSRGTYDISGGTLRVVGNLVVGDQGTGRFHVLGDEATVDVAGFTQNALSTLELDINGLSPIQVNGSVSLGGYLDVEFLTPPSPGEYFPIILNDGTDPVAGIFEDMPEGMLFMAPGSGYPVQISYVAGTGNDVALVVAPEPGTLALFGMTVAGILARRRRGKRQTPR